MSKKKEKGSFGDFIILTLFAGLVMGLGFTIVINNLDIDKLQQQMENVPTRECHKETSTEVIDFSETKIYAIPIEMLKHCNHVNILGQSEDGIYIEAANTNSKCWIPKTKEVCQIK